MTELPSRFLFYAYLHQVPGVIPGPAVSSGAPAAASSAPAAASSGLSDLEIRVKEQGDKVRALKQAKAPKDEIEAAVAALLALKKELEASGHAAAAPAPAAAAKAEATTEPSEGKAEKVDTAAARKAAKAAKAAQRGGAAPVAAEDGENTLVGAPGPILHPIKTIEDGPFGTLPLHQSQWNVTRSWTRIDQLNSSLADETVWIRARLYASRGKGKACFLVLRQQLSTVQATLFVTATISAEMVKFASGITKESIIDVFGTVKTAETKIEGCTQHDIEIEVSRLYVISSSSPVLPFEIDDAARPEKEEEDEDVQHVRVLMDTRLDNRWVDLRTPANQAIFRIQHAVSMLFREHLTSKGFIEIHTPKLIGGTSEGGSEVFRLDYFGRDACLAQSPQLYKQMAICADFDRVFEIGAVFRAENSNTHRHMCEFVGLDLEMAFNDSYIEVVDVIDHMFTSVFDGINTLFKKELETVNAQFAFEDIVYTKPSLRLTFPEAVSLLRENGITIDEFGDLSTADEKALGKIVKEKYNTDFYFLLRYPANARPFYTMPCADDPRYTNSYDIFLRGEEITSGAQRIHDADSLTRSAIAKGIKPSTIQAYVDSFRSGAPPHGGCGIGLERVVMLFLNLHNIRRSSLFPRTPNRLSP